MKNKIPKVFISYSWDNEVHKEWVLKLANLLRLKGVDVILDVWELKAGKDKDFFMENSVRISDKILLIMTHNYKIKAENRKGGVANEISMIRAEKFNNQEIEKFIPIVRSGNREDCTPLFAKSLVDIDMSIEDNFDKSFEELLRTIYDEPENEKPPLGEKPQFTKPKLFSDFESLNLAEEESQLNKQKPIKNFSLDFESNMDLQNEIYVEERPCLLAYSQKELINILLKFEQEGRKVIFLFGSVMSGQSMFLASLMYFACRSTSKKWIAEIPTNYPFDSKNISKMINVLDAQQVMCSTNMNHGDFIGINVVPYNKKFPVLKLAFVHIAGEHYIEILTKGKLNQKLELLLKCGTFVNPSFFLITPYKSYHESKNENDLHLSFISYLKENLPKVCQVSRFYIVVSQWDKNVGGMEIEKYIELCRPVLFNFMNNNKKIKFGEYSIGNIIELTEEPFLYLAKLNVEYPNNVWNSIYKSYTNKNL